MTGRKAPSLSPAERTYLAIEAEAARLQREAGLFRSFMSDVTTYDRAALCGPNPKRQRECFWVARSHGSHIVWLPDAPTEMMREGVRGTYRDPIHAWRREWSEACALAFSIVEPGDILYRVDIERVQLRAVKPTDITSIADECQWHPEAS